MNCIPLQAKEIKEICFNEKIREMFVKFRTGEVHVFLSFNKQLLDDFANAVDSDSYYRKHLMCIPHEIRR